MLEVCRPVLWLLARAFLRIRFHGVEHVPRTGPVLLAPNHVSYLDPVLVSLPLHRPLHYMTLEKFFRVPVLGPLIRWCRAFPVREGEVDQAAVRRAVRILRAGEGLVVFPEGGRSPDGRLGPFRHGAFWIAVMADAPVVPVSIAGADRVWPVGRRLPRPGRVRVTYHPPVTVKDLPPTAGRKALPALMAALVRERIAAAL